MGNNNNRVAGGTPSLTLKVTPAELRAQSESVAVDVGRISSQFEDISRIMDSSDSFWRGDSAERFRGAYNGYKDEITEIVLRLSEHITDLNQMAGVYESGENEIVDYIGSLPSDVIV